MKRLRILLLPFSWIYGSIIFTRNLFFNWGIFKSHNIPKKSICVGNLSVGGTGKTPHVDLLVNRYIEKGLNVSTLSRGYGRSTKGIMMVQEDSTAQDVGDEPLLYKLKYKDKLNVFVAEKRILGIRHILNKYPNNDLIVLDDAFQHRAIKAGLNILTTDYSNLFVDDFLMPTGNLREPAIGRKRAHIIIVSNSPTELTKETKQNIIKKLNSPSQYVFFSSVEYTSIISFNHRNVPQAENVLLVTGIGNPSLLLDHLSHNYNVVHLKYKDHHRFTNNDIRHIHEKFDTFANRNKIIVTTEKDFMRLKNFEAVDSNVEHWFYQPIKIKIKEEEKFNLRIDEYVIKN